MLVVVRLFLLVMVILNVMVWLGRNGLGFIFLLICLVRERLNIGMGCFIGMIVVLLLFFCVLLLVGVEFLLGWMFMLL